MASGISSHSPGLFGHGWPSTVQRRSVPSGALIGEALRKQFSLAQLLARVSESDKAVVTRQLSTLVGAGIPLVEALTALIDQVDNPKLKVAIGQIRQRVNEGASLADAMAQHSNLFSPLYVNMIRAGEAGGVRASELCDAYALGIADRQIGARRDAEEDGCGGEPREDDEPVGEGVAVRRDDHARVGREGIRVDRGHEDRIRGRVGARHDAVRPAPQREPEPALEQQVACSGRIEARERLARHGRVLHRVVSAESDDDRAKGTARADVDGLDDAGPGRRTRDRGCPAVAEEHLAAPDPVALADRERRRDAAVVLREHPDGGDRGPVADLLGGGAREREI